MSITTVDPTTARTVCTFDALTGSELDDKLERAVQAFRTWRRWPIADRTAVLIRAADILEAEQAECSRVMTLEVGKLVRAALQETLKCARVCRYYADHAEEFLADEPVPTEATRSLVRYQPLGPLLAVMPWNFPFWQVFRFAAPALAAGNVVLLKHASNVPQCALLIENILRRAGSPPGVFQTLLVEVDQVGQIVDDARVAGVTLTGSEYAGRQVAARAGHALKKVVLELGGSDPFIVMPSADMALAIEAGVHSRMINNGQSCIAAKRFIVTDAIADAFEAGFTQRVRALRIGDPSDESTEVGPLASAVTLSTLHKQVRETVDAGARLLTGGTRLDRPGHFYVPTVLADVPLDSPAYRDELFGPVAAVFRVPDLDAAICLANDTRFGLGCSVWTNDVGERERVADEVDVGQIFVNGMVVSDPRLPFGGVKQSGYGRELGAWGLREFVNVKTVWVRDPSGESPRMSE